MHIYIACLCPLHKPSVSIPGLVPREDQILRMYRHTALRILQVDLGETPRRSPSVDVLVTAMR